MGRGGSVEIKFWGMLCVRIVSIMFMSAEFNFVYQFQSQAAGSSRSRSVGEGLHPSRQTDKGAPCTRACEWVWVWVCRFDWYNCCSPTYSYFAYSGFLLEGGWEGAFAPPWLWLAPLGYAEISVLHVNLFKHL